MESFSAINMIGAKALNGTNGALSTYMLEFMAETDILTGDNIMITFPNEIRLTNMTKCYGNISSCNASTYNELRVQMKFPKGLLPSYTYFSINVTGVRNAPSTIESSIFYDLSLRDNNTNLVAFGVEPNATVRNTEPALAKGALIIADKMLNATTNYTINYTNVNPLPNGVSFRIGVPKSIIVAEQLDTCVIFINQDPNIVECYVNTFDNIIVIVNT